MTKHFVVFAPELTPAEEGAFALNLSGIDWWHHLPGCWLITDPKGKLTAADLRDLVKGPSRVNCAVFRVEPSSHWATVLPKSVTSKSREWLEAHWAEPPKNALASE